LLIIEIYHFPRGELCMPAEFGLQTYVKYGKYQRLLIIN